MHGDQADELLASAAAEAGRLSDVVATLQAALAQAQGELDLVRDWPPDRLAVLRNGLRRPRFADVQGLSMELETARQELEAVQELRRRASAR